MASEDDSEQARRDLLARAERAAVAVGRSVQGKAPETEMQTNAGSLTALAMLLASLLEEARACGGTHCMGRSIDGVKLWVTQDQFQAVQAREARYAAALRQIAAADTGGDSFDMLVDWRDTVITLGQIARDALDAGQPRS